MKKNIFVIILSIFLFFIIFPLNIVENNTSIIYKKDFKERLSNTEYFDWNDTKVLDSKYSYSTLFYTDNTRIVRLSGGSNYVESVLSGNVKIASVNVWSGDKFKMAITNCAIDEDGDLIDVIIEIKNVMSYAKHNGYVTLEMKNVFPLITSQTSPSTNVVYHGVSIGSPILFGLNAQYANCDFSITYYKAGTYVFDSNSGIVSGELANITHVNGIFSDIDVPTRDGSAQNFIYGYEGFRPNVGSSQIYYNRDSNPPVGGKKFNKYLLQQIDNGIAIKSANFDSNGKRINPDGIWFATSALMLTKDLEKSYYEFTYGGEKCGIYYMCASPYVFEIDPPKKSVNVSEVFCGDTFEYTVSQYIPNNYYGTLISFHEKYPQLYANTRYSSISIKDKIDSNLIIDEDNIQIVNENDVDSKMFFNIEINDNEVNAVAQDTALNNYLFYSHTYYLKIPVIVKDGVSNVDYIPNIARVISTIEDDPPLEYDTPEVDVRLKYRLTVNYYDEMTGEKIIPSKETTYYNGDQYTTNYDDVGSEWVYLSDSGNTSGEIHKDVVVDYYFSKYYNAPVTGGKGIYLYEIVGIILLIITLIVFMFVKFKKII